MISNSSASLDGQAMRETVNLEASYAFDGMPSKLTRVHEISASGLRILTREQLTLRRVISIEILCDGDKRVCLLGQIMQLVGRREGILFDYELKILGENTLQTALQSTLIKKKTDERRPATRVAVNLKATYKLGGASSRPTRVNQISASGLRILTTDELPLKALITVDIVFELNQRVTVLGQVIRLAGRNGDLFDYGIKVIDGNNSRNPLRSAVLNLTLKGATKPKPGVAAAVRP